MSIQAKLMDDMKIAMKAGDKLRLETIRGIRSQMKNSEIEKGRPLTEEDEIQVLLSAAKRRRESIEQFRLGNRLDRAAEEEKELGIIQEYLPKQMSEEEIFALVSQIIQEVSASSPNDMGKVMGKLMPQVKGRADGKIVQRIVQQKLAAL
jgi:uncharacterized protein YqeY